MNAVNSVWRTGRKFSTTICLLPGSLQIVILFFGEPDLQSFQLVPTFLHLAMGCSNQRQSNNTHTLTQTVLTAIFPNEPGLASCLLTSPSPFITQMELPRRYYGLINFVFHVEYRRTCARFVVAGCPSCHQPAGITHWTSSFL